MARSCSQPPPGSRCLTAALMTTAKLLERCAAVERAARRRAGSPRITRRRAVRRPSLPWRRLRTTGAASRATPPCNVGTCADAVSIACALRRTRHPAHLRPRACPRRARVGAQAGQDGPAFLFGALREQWDQRGANLLHPLGRPAPQQVLPLLHMIELVFDVLGLQALRAQRSGQCFCAGAS